MATTKPVMDHPQSDALPPEPARDGELVADEFPWSTDEADASDSSQPEQDMPWLAEEVDPWELDGAPDPSPTARIVLPPETPRPARDKRADRGSRARRSGRATAAPDAAAQPPKPPRDSRPARRTAAPTRPRRVRRAHLIAAAVVVWAALGTYSLLSGGTPRPSTPQPAAEVTPAPVVADGVPLEYAARASVQVVGHQASGAAQLVWRAATAQLRDERRARARKRAQARARARERARKRAARNKPAPTPSVPAASPSLPPAAPTVSQTPAPVAPKPKPKPSGCNFPPC